MESHSSIIRILVVEDDPDWRKLLRLILKRHLGKTVQITVAENYQKARAAVFKKSYDLISLDLKLSENEYGESYSGRSLLESIRRESREPSCGLIILSGFGTEDIAVESLRDYRVDDFIKKSRVNLGEPLLYVNAVKKALLRSLLRRAEAAVNSRISLTLTFNRLGLIDGELRAPNRITKSTKPRDHGFNISNVSDASDKIGQKILYGRKGAWRGTAKRIGRELFKNLSKVSPIYDLFVIGRELSAASASALHLQFNGPLQNLKLPFELMYDEDYLVFTHVITRGLTEGNRGSERFHEFIKRLYGREKLEKPNSEPLQVVILGANTFESTPMCEDEAETVAKTIRRNLELLDIPHNIKLLVGKDATYRNLENSLRDGCHIFHFAGHASYVKSVPEKSMIYLYDRKVSAASLKSLLRNKDTRFAFLSCCLGAQVGSKGGRGDFSGFLDALSKAGVPTILGYRWAVNDYSAKLLAASFYDLLFRNFCPGQSLYLARDRAASEIGRDEDVWASAVLFMQN